MEPTPMNAYDDTWPAPHEGDVTRFLDPQGTTRHGTVESVAQHLGVLWIRENGSHARRLITTAELVHDVPENQAPRHRHG